MGEVPGLGQRWRTRAVPLTIGRALGQAAEFAGWLVIARQLEPDDFGRLSVAVLIVRYAGMVADWGGNLTGPSEAGGHGPASTIDVLARHRSRTGMALAGLFALVMAGLGLPELAPLGVVTACVGLQRDWLAIGRGEALGATAPSMIRGVAFLGATPFVDSVTSAAAAYGVAWVVATACSMWITEGAPKVRRSSAGALPSAWPLVATLAAQVYISFDTVLLGALRSTEDAGIYAAVYRLPLAWITVVGLATTAFIPLASESLNRSEPKALLRRAMRVGALGGTLVLASIPALLAVFDQLFSSDYDTGRTPMAIILIATAIVTMGAPIGAIVVAQRRYRSNALIVLVGAGGNLLLNLAVIPHWGMTGSAWTTVATEALVLGLLLLTAARIEDGDAPT